MSRVEGPARILAAATVLGASRGVGALTIQAIAKAAGVSKALVLYHYADKTTLLNALYGELGAASAARIRTAALTADPLSAWRSLVVREVEAGQLALFSALSREAEVREAGAHGEASVREADATALASAIFRALGLTPRISPSLLGSVLLRHLDGIAFRRDAAETDTARATDAAALAAALEAALEAELDGFALAFLALGD